MAREREEFLDHLFGTYREVLGDFEPSPSFTARVWQQIEARRNDSGGWVAHLCTWAPRLAAASALATVLMAAYFGSRLDGGEEAVLLDASYVDVLALDSMEEQDGALWMLAENGR